MNPVHLHLMLNHVPVLGVAFGLALVGLSLWRKSEELKRVSLGFLIVVAALSIPAYLTGEPAEKIVEDLPGVSEDVIEQHEEAAQVAFVGVLILGAVALCGLIFFRGETRVPNWLSVTVLVMSVIVFALMAWTANLGGLIRHPEIRPDFHAATKTEKPG
ncbi:MAG: hypothetical protein WCE49_07960 [Terrimicrobiaceae bacterium]